MLHTTCCFLRDGPIHLNAELEDPLRIEGAEVVHLLTDGVACTYAHLLPEPKAAHCVRRRTGALRYLQETKGRVFELEQFAEIADAQTIDDWKRLCTALPVERHNFDGLDLWDIVKGSVTKRLESDTIPDLDHLAPIEAITVKRILANAVRYILTFRRVYESLRPTHVLVFNGMFYLERIAVLVGKRFDVQPIATEGSCFFDRTYFDSSAAIGNSHSFPGRIAAQLEREQLTPGERARLQRFLDTVFTRGNNFVRQPIRRREGTAREVKRSGRTRVLFLAQVPFDSVISYDSPVFPSMGAALRATVDLFRARPNCDLTIKLHPGRSASGPTEEDPIVRSARGDRFPGNVVVAPETANTYELMEAHHVGITVCSQAGLEMLSLYKPVVVLGRAFYARLGMTFDVRAPDEYGAVLDAALAAPCKSRRERHRIDLFLYRFIFDFLVPVDRGAGRVRPEALSRITDLLHDVPPSVAHRPPAGAHHKP